MTDDPLRWESDDGESPSTFGALAALPWMLLAYAALAAYLWLR